MKLSISIFLHFRTQQVFPRYFAKFQSVTKIRTRCFQTFISQNLRPPFPSKSWLRIRENTTGVEIVITISTAICIKNNKNFVSYIRAIFYFHCYYNFNPCSIFEKMTSFSPILNQNLEQGKSLAAVNSRKKGPKDMSSNFRNGLKFGISRKDLLCTKM